ncbi:MAG TPA: hypothetical protein DDY78_03470 [Planctomycetales bacterium]|jgi:hypothetical protein|nr:hypothetical protein [Planctomycetales bacterium]
MSQTSIRGPVLPFLSVLIVLAVAAAEPAPSFDKQVAPLLQSRCLKCHNPAKARGDLDLSTRDTLLKGGEKGVVVVPGKSRESALFAKVRDGKMPPGQPLGENEVELVRRWIDDGAPWKEGLALKPPSNTEKGRAGPDWWSLQPIRRPNAPPVINRLWVRTPIDAFILAPLEAKGLRPAPEADRRTLIRRLTFDLIGLPPTPEEIDAFVRDAAADAYEKLVDRLLARPEYGERWGRHWLDVTRFAESHGYEMNTLRPNAWPYRDYVIRAFNEDIPYRQFVYEQLAADALGKDDMLTEAATGFLVGGPHDLVGNAMPEVKIQQRMDDMADMVSLTGTTFLGLTVGCARCHDHKFDPISQKDFYSFQAVFAGVEHAERPLRQADTEARRREADAQRAELARIDVRLDEQETPAEESGAPLTRPPVQPRRNVERFRPITARYARFTIAATTDGTEPCLDELEVYGPDAPTNNLALANRGAKPSASSVYPNNPSHKIEHLNDGRFGNGRSWISNERGKGWAQVEFPKAETIDRVVWGRDREQKYADRLASDYRIAVSPDGEKWTAVAGSWDRLPFGQAPPAPSEERNKLLSQRKRMEERLAALEKPMTIYAGAFHAPDTTFVLKRGDPAQKGEEVGPSGVRSVAPAFALKPEAPETERRMALANWIASPENPLPARVMVNRLWHWHFGQGIVRTPSDFGFNGDRPSHPELLDWLAAEFQSNGWKLKPLHRLIVLSSAYRQSTRFNAKAAALDADDRLLWRRTPRRLEAEAIRDAVLQTSGALNPRRGGPGYNLWEYSGYVIVFNPKKTLGAEEFRRMVYQFKPRLQQDQTFGVFDCPDATQTTPRRTTSTTPLQALNLLNDPFMLDQGERFAARLRKEAGEAAPDQVRRAFRLAFGRDPSPDEATAAERLIRADGLAIFCRALFNTNEFVFVD